MRIGVDIDGVLTNIEEFELDYGSKYFYENKILSQVIKNIDFTKTNLNIDDAISNEFWANGIYDYINIPPRNFASEVIKKLKEKGNTIYIITNRTSNLSYCDITPVKMKEIVINWLQKNLIYYDKLIFSNGDKTKFIIDNKIDIMIEDNPKNIKAISKIIPVFCYNSRSNIECKGKNIIRGYSWYDIYNKLEEMK